VVKLNQIPPWQQNCCTESLPVVRGWQWLHPRV